MPIRLLLVEDDPLQSEAILQGLEAAFPKAGIKHIRSEKEFRDRIDEIVRFKPDAAIFDMMLRWTDPDAIVIDEIPEEVKREKHYRAGLRCRELLVENLRFVQLFLYTILEEVDLGQVPDDVTYVPKGPDIGPLITELKQHLAL